MRAPFIRRNAAYTTDDEHIAAPLLRRRFHLDATPSSATLSVATGGFYELYVNGRALTKGHLSPYIASPDILVAKDTYDLTDVLTEGENVIALLLGNGFANQIRCGWDFDKAEHRAAPSVAVELSCTVNGQPFTLGSDTLFRTHPSHITFDMYRLGTHVDRRAYLDGWCEVNFDDSGWDAAELAPSPKGEIVPCTAHPLLTSQRLAPVSVERREDFCYLRTAYRGGTDLSYTHVDEGYLYDFGKSLAGACILRVRGERGQRITLRHGERLAPDGTFTLNSIYTYKPDSAKTYIPPYQCDEVILRGGVEEVRFPFTYHGFRYVLVEGLTEEQATPDLLTFEVFHSALPRRAHFSSSHSVVNTLYDMGIAADLSNFHYFPTDCPHREKNGWTGDIGASADQMLLHFDAADSFALWLRQLALSQREDGMIPCIVPTDGWGFAWGNGPVMDRAMVTVAYHAYRYDGRTDLFDTIAPTVERYLSFILSTRDARGLVDWGLGDWVQPGYKTRGFLAPIALTSSAYVVDLARKTAHLAHRTGRPALAAAAEAAELALTEAIRTHLIDGDLAAGHCQTSQALCLSMELFPPEVRADAYRRLIEQIHADGDHAVCGVVGLQHIFEVLLRGGDGELAMRMITRPDAPSYGSMIERGATALCEALEENGVQESENHHFLGDPLRLFVSTLAGLSVNPTATDPSTLVFAPHPTPSVARAEASYDFPCGTVTGGYAYEGERVRLFVRVPEGVDAVAVIGGREHALTVGEHTWYLT